MDKEASRIYTGTFYIVDGKIIYTQDTDENDAIDHYDLWQMVVPKIFPHADYESKEELKEEGWRNDDWYEKYPEDLNHYEYPEEVIEQFKKAAEAVRIAQIYIQRMDWLLSGDDGEESFLRRLNEELKNKSYV